MIFGYDVGIPSENMYTKFQIDISCTLGDPLVSTSVCTMCPVRGGRSSWRLPKFAPNMDLGRSILDPIWTQKSIFKEGSRQGWEILAVQNCSAILVFLFA